MHVVDKESFEVRLGPHSRDDLDRLGHVVAGSAEISASITTPHVPAATDGGVEDASPRRNLAALPSPSTILHNQGLLALPSRHMGALSGGVPGSARD